MMRWAAGMALVTMSAVWVTTGAAGQTAPTPATTVQQDFEAAATLDAGADQAAALAAWEALEKRIARSKRNRAVVMVRKAAVLLKLGRGNEASDAATSGLADLSAGDATLRGDRFRAQLIRARVAADSLDYASAVAAYQAAEALADGPAQKITALIGLVDTATFVDPAVAAGAVTRADAVLASVSADAKTEARVRQVKSHLLLNGGDFAGAKREAMAAVKLLGGLTSRTDIADVSARSDVSIAALLGGDAAVAREYMAMTGAGRLPKGSFDPAVRMKVPDCGGEAELKPADIAVVEFSIGDDGAVVAATPIYAAGGGDVALAFARAASRWSWTPEQVKALPPFFRYNARVELRCSTAFERPSVADLMTASLETWLEEKGIATPTPTDQPDAIAIAGLRNRLASAEAASGPGALAIVPVLRALAENAVVGREERLALNARALAILVAADAPPLARLAFDLSVRANISAEALAEGDYVRAVTPLVTAKPYVDDPQSRSALRLFLADAERRRSSERTRLLLRQIGDDAALPANDPLRVGALIRLASLEQEEGDAATARAAFDRSGLAASQCAIIDKPPTMVRAGGVFPLAAQQWGFEGWTQTQFDVAADGRVVNERAVLSYPPFIFTKAGTEALATSRFTKTYRPDGGLGCGGSTQRVKFVLP